MPATGNFIFLVRSSKTIIKYPIQRRPILRIKKSMNILQSQTIKLFDVPCSKWKRRGNSNSRTNTKIKIVEKDEYSMFFNWNGANVKGTNTKQKRNSINVKDKLREPTLCQCEREKRWKNGSGEHEFNQKYTMVLMPSTTMYIVVIHSTINMHSMMQCLCFWFFKRDQKKNEERTTK